MAAAQEVTSIPCKHFNTNENIFVCAGTAGPIGAGIGITDRGWERKLRNLGPEKNSRHEAKPSAGCFFRTEVAKFSPSLRLGQ